MPGQQQTPIFASLPLRRLSNLALVCCIFASFLGVVYQPLALCYISANILSRNVHISGVPFSPRSWPLKRLVSLATLQCIQANGVFYPTPLIVSGRTWLCCKRTYYIPKWHSCASSNFKYNEWVIQ